MGWETGTKREFKFDPNSTENEGRFRLFDPKKIDEGSYFRRNSSTPGISYVMGKAGGKTVIQAVRFNKEEYKEQGASRWWKDNYGRGGLVFSDERKASVRSVEEAQEINRQVAEWAHRTGETGAHQLAGISRWMAKGVSLEEAVRKVYRNEEIQRRRVWGDELFEDMNRQGKLPWMKFLSSDKAMNKVAVVQELVSVAKSLVAAEVVPAWVATDFVNQVDVSGTSLKKYGGKFQGVSTWILKAEGRVYKDRFGAISMSWEVNPMLQGQEWVVESKLGFAPATSGSFAREKFEEFKRVVSVSGKSGFAVFGWDTHVLTVGVDERNALREVGGLISQHGGELDEARRYWKKQAVLFKQQFGVM